MSNVITNKSLNKIQKNANYKIGFMVIISS